MAVMATMAAKTGKAQGLQSDAPKLQIPSLFGNIKIKKYKIPELCQPE